MISVLSNGQVVQGCTIKNPCDGSGHKTGRKVTETQLFRFVKIVRVRADGTVRIVRWAQDR